MAIVQADSLFLDQNMMSFAPLGSGFQETEPFYENFTSSSSSLGRNASPSEDLAQCLYSELENQRLEIDGFIQLENQRLRKSILQQQAMQHSLLLQKLESRIKNLILLKDQELALARNRSFELQDLLVGVQIEAKAWERKATEKAQIIAYLNNRLNNIRDEGTVSLCDSCPSSKGEQESKKMSGGGGCKLCLARESCVVFLPCRHLCCCKCCESLLEQCLVCDTPKGATLEVFLD